MECPDKALILSARGRLDSWRKEFPEAASKLEAALGEHSRYFLGGLDDLTAAIIANYPPLKANLFHNLRALTTRMLALIFEAITDPESFTKNASPYTRQNKEG